MRIGSEWQRKRIGVLTGGLSAAREVSLQTGEAVYQALIDRGYKATRIFVDRDVDIALRQSGVEVAFLALHGRYGEDGCLQGLLEILGIPYTGSGVTASALAMNKIKSREIFRLRNLPTPPYYVVDPTRMDRLIADHGAFGFPVVVKPCSLGGSMGVTVARCPRELQSACEQALLFDSRVLVERYIDGMEVQVAVLDGQPLGAVEVKPQDGIYSFRDKTRNGRCEFFLPARLSQNRMQGILTQARKAHEALGCSGITLVDMLLSETGNEFLLEVNALPTYTATSVLPMIARAAGYDFGDLVEAVLETASLKAGGEETRRAHDLPSFSLLEDEALVVGAAGPN